MPRITVHGARRTCGSLLVDLDVHPRVAMQILRHANFNITMEIYSQVSSAATAGRAQEARGGAELMASCSTLLLYGLLAALAMIFDKPLSWGNGGAGGTRTRDRRIMSPLL